MVLDSETEALLRTFRFDGTLLELGPEEAIFFKAETGIQDPKELRKHVVDVHEEAYKASTCLLACNSVVQTLWFAFRSIHILAFARSRLRRSRSPGHLCIRRS